MFKKHYIQIHDLMFKKPCLFFLHQYTLLTNELVHKANCLNAQS